MSAVPVTVPSRAFASHRRSSERVGYQDFNLIGASEARQAVGKAREGACGQGGATLRVVPACPRERGMIDGLCASTCFRLQAIGCPQALRAHVFYKLFLCCF